MNKTKRQGIFFISIFVVMFAGPYLLKWTTYQCVILLSFFALVMKLSDIEDTMGEIRYGPGKI